MAFLTKSTFRMVIIVAITMVPSGVFARDLMAKKDGVQVFSEPQKGSTVLTTLKKDESLSENGRKGMYWKVDLKDGKTGYVSVMKVKFKTKDSDTALSSALRDAVRQGRSSDDASNIRNRSAVMGVRGLDESNEAAFAGNAKPNPRLIFQMENFVLEESKVELIGKLVEDEIEAKLNKKRKR